MKFLINPGGKKMAVRRKRDARGRFIKAGARKRTRRNPPRKATPRRRASPAKAAPRARKRTYRRNPRKPDVVQMLTRGTLTATQVLLGKAAVRAIPDLAKLPKNGNTGLAVQVAVALALGYVGEMFFTKNTAAALLAGGLTAPVETLIVSANIPYVSGYLSPSASGTAVQGYVQGYVAPSRPLAGYVSHDRGGMMPAAWNGAGYDEDGSFGYYN